MPAIRLTVFVLSAVFLACEERGPPFTRAQTGDAPAACAEGEAGCDGLVARICRAGAWVERACDNSCVDGNCVDCVDGACGECGEGERRCASETTAELCRDGRYVTLDCGLAGCVEGGCVCPPDPYRCSASGRERCQGSGDWTAEACPSDLPICRDGKCLRCEPDSTVCVNENTSRICSENGQSETTIACANGCDPSTGHCFVESCGSPGALRCRPGRHAVERCADDGTQYQLVAKCDEDGGEVCDQGECVSSCDLADSTKAPWGCSFHAPPVPFINQSNQGTNFTGEPGPPTRFHILNPDPYFVAEDVVVFQSGAEVARFSIPPGSYQTAQVPGLSVSPIESTRMTDAAVTIRSKRAVFVVHHLELRGWGYAGGENSHSGDTAFLLPDHLLREYGTRYRVMTQPTCTAHANIRPGGFTVLPLTGEGSARIRMTLTTATAPGPLNDPPAHPAGTGPQNEIDVAAGEVVHFRAAGGSCGQGTCAAEDLTGSLLESIDGRPFAVFNGGVSRVDCVFSNHAQNQLLEQLMPIPLWGGGAEGPHVLMARPGAEEEWAIVTHEEANELNFSPPLSSGMDTYVLAAPGDRLRFNTSLLGGAFKGYRAFKLESSKPILMGRYHYGLSTFTLERPMRFWRTEYHVASVGASGNRLLMVAPEGDQIVLDGTQLEAPSAGGPTGYQVFDVPVSQGAHRLSSGKTFGILVYSGTRADAYSYMGPVGFDDGI